VQQAAVFVDRDGVIVESRRHAGLPRPAESVDDVVIPPGVQAALASIRAAGYLVIAVTNQPDVARGTTSRSTVEAINSYVTTALPVDAVYTCFHDGDSCSCRKPRPGMLLQAASDHAVDLERSWMIGDRWVDIAAGHAAGVRTVMLERPYSWEPTHQGHPPAGLQPDAVGDDFAQCAAAVLGSASRVS
jgi:D-glycero-D-manno-heptose 1,7-bisphosphate phosphatase